MDEASNAAFTYLFSRYFDHDFVPGSVESHASGSRGYLHYCRTGEISEATQARIEGSLNMEIYRQIRAAAAARRGAKRDR